MPITFGFTKGLASAKAHQAVQREVAERELNEKLRYTEVPKNFANTPFAKLIRSSINSGTDICSVFDEQMIGSPSAKIALPHLNKGGFQIARKFFDIEERHRQPIAL